MVTHWFDFDAPLSPDCTSQTCRTAIDQVLEMSRYCGVRYSELWVTFCCFGFKSISGCCVPQCVSTQGLVAVLGPEFWMTLYQMEAVVNEWLLRPSTSTNEQENLGTVASSCTDYLSLSVSDSSILPSLSTGESTISWACRSCWHNICHKSVSDSPFLLSFWQVAGRFLSFPLPADIILFGVLLFVASRYPIHCLHRRFLQQPGLRPTVDRLCALIAFRIYQQNDFTNIFDCVLYYTNYEPGNNSAFNSFISFNLHSASFSILH